MRARQAHGNETPNLANSHAGLHACTATDPLPDDDACTDTELGMPRDDDDPSWLTINGSKSDLEAAYDELRWRTANDPRSVTTGSSS